MVHIIENGKIKTTKENLDVIDYDMIYIIDKLNSYGIETVYCCAGHSLYDFENGKFGSGAYLVIKKNIETKLFTDLLDTDIFDIEDFENDKINIHCHPKLDKDYIYDKNHSCIYAALKIRLIFIEKLENTIKSYIEKYYSLPTPNWTNDMFNDSKEIVNGFPHKYD